MIGGPGGNWKMGGATHHQSEKPSTSSCASGRGSRLGRPMGSCSYLYGSAAKCPVVALGLLFVNRVSTQKKKSGHRVRGSEDKQDPLSPLPLFVTQPPLESNGYTPTSHILCKFFFWSSLTQRLQGRGSWEM